MTTTHSTAFRNTICTQLNTAINGGTGNGQIEIQASDNSEVATVGFAATAFQAPSAGVMTANATTADSSATGGTADHFEFQDGDGTMHAAGACGTSGSGAEMILSTLTIAATASVTLTSVQYTAAP